MKTKPSEMKQAVGVCGNVVNAGGNVSFAVNVYGGGWEDDIADDIANEGPWRHWTIKKKFPFSKAVEAGLDSDSLKIFVGRAAHIHEDKTLLLPAKVFPDVGTALVSYDGREFVKNSCEVLCIPNALWVEAKDGIIPPNAIEGGYTSSGEVLYIGRGEFNGSRTPGKVVPSKRMLYIPYGCHEVAMKRFEILVEGPKPTAQSNNL